MDSLCEALRTNHIKTTLSSCL